MWLESAISNDQVKLVLNQCGQVKLVFRVCRVYYIYILICLMLIWVQPRGAYASLLRSTSIYSMRTFQKIDPEFWCFLVKKCYPVWTLGSTISVSPRRLMISNTAARTSDRFVGVKAWLMANQTRVKKGKPHSWLDLERRDLSSKTCFSRKTQGISMAFNSNIMYNGH